MTPDWLNHGFEALLRGLALPRAVGALRILFFVLIALLLVFLLRSRRAGQKDSAAPAWRTHQLVFLAVMFLFLAVLAYQASWQLAGFARPKFMLFMTQHNKRSENLAENIQRGRILDMRGTVLAEGSVGKDSRRRHPLGAALAHPVGYLSARFGTTGIESAEDAYLNGFSLQTPDEWNRMGRNLLDHRNVNGNDLRLTLDARLQLAAWSALQGRRGAVVMLRPADGALLVLASSPACDPDTLDALDSPSFAIRGRKRVFWRG